MIYEFVIAPASRARLPLARICSYCVSRYLMNPWADLRHYICPASVSNQLRESLFEFYLPRRHNFCLLLSFSIKIIELLVPIYQSDFVILCVKTQISLFSTLKTNVIKVMENELCWGLNLNRLNSSCYTRVLARLLLIGRLVIVMSRLLLIVKLGFVMTRLLLIGKWAIVVISS